MKCIDCDRNAEHIRHTQFAGSHPYCGRHAKLEKDFNGESSYFLWEILNGKENGPQIDSGNSTI